MLVPANGVTLHAQALGAGPPVVMLHGLLVGSVASWFFTAAPALARSHRVWLYDLRGHGLSERAATGYDLCTQTADLRALLDRVQPGPVALAGHSYGALVALRLALDDPARVRRLALVEAPLPPGRVDEMRAFVDRLAGDGPGNALGAMPAAQRAALTAGGRRAARLAASLDFLARGSSLLADLAAEPDLPDQALRALGCPVLCVYGRESSCRGTGERLTRVIPGARLELLPGGHYLHLDSAPALARILVEFFDA